MDVKAIRAAAAAQVAAGGPLPSSSASSKRKRSASKDTAAAAAADGSSDADKTDAEEPEQPAETTKKQKKKKHKVLAREAAEAAALAASDGANQAPEEPSADTDEDAAARENKSRRTVFVGNVSLDATAKDLKAFFTPCGKVETVRLRYLPLAGCAVDQAGNQKLVMKVCANKKILTAAKDNCNAYVTFADEASVPNALALNGAQLLRLPVRVDHETPVVDPRRSVFIGNVGFRVSDESVRRFFEQQLASDEEPQPVVNVRIIRDRATGAGKGFGYVLLRSAALAGQALALHESKLEGRELRVQVCGKRFKNRKGEKEKEASGSESRMTKTTSMHEGVRASAGAQARLAAKRKASGGPPPLQAKKNVGAKVVKTSKKPAAKHEVRPAKTKQTKTPGGAKTKTFKKAGVGGKKASGRVFEPKAKKPKHAARKARQAAEAAAARK